MISNCGKNENGKLVGGIPGDQTGQEWEIRTWYSRPWTFVARFPEDIAKEIARLATEAAQNNNVGYGQDDRETFWAAMVAMGFKVKDIRVKCAADCSCGTLSIVKAVGHILNKTPLININHRGTTSTAASQLKAAGATILSGPQYLKGDSLLLPGDILIAEGKHMCVNLSVGTNVPIASGGSAGTTYVIKGGDTLSKVARNYNTTVAAIMKLNPSIKDANKISVGLVVRVR